jgi:glucosamine--fructose-6-phosphate aminotransferase (isomerizing)
MNQNSSYGVVNDMFDTIDIVQKIDTHAIQPIMSYISNKSWIVLTGEGSSRIFPAKMMRHQAMRYGYHQHIVTQWWLQLMEYDLSTYAVLACSNSGKTKEIVSLLSNLQQQGHQACIWITAWQQTPLHQVTQYCHILQSWEEHACAATKTVIEQWLLYDMILWSVTWIQWDYQNLSTLMSQTLQYTISNDIVEIIAQASKLYFAGRNDGVAEELALKTYEIIKKPAQYLEWTFAVHGIEEIMEPNEVVIVINPYPSEEEKFEKVLSQNIGMNIIAIADRQTRFPTITIPSIEYRYQWYLQMLAGRNILTATGIYSGIDIDHTVRARKIGNEVVS